MLGPRFLVLFGEENNCPNDYAPHTFHSYENFCEWLKKGGPQLQDCVSTVVSDHIVINGIIDTKGHIGQCCNIPVSILTACIYIYIVHIIFNFLLYCKFSINIFVSVRVYILNPKLVVKLVMVLRMVNFQTMAMYLLIKCFMAHSIRPMI